MSINSIVLSGNLVRNPEVKTTTSDFTILTFTIAVNSRKKNADTGEWEDTASFIDCKMFGNRAAYVADKLEKGMKVCVEGRIEQNKWVGRDGTNKSKLEVVVNEIEFLTQRKPREEEPARSPEQARELVNQIYETAKYGKTTVYEDDPSIPF